jgi:hypothetical protein
LVLFSLENYPGSKSVYLVYFLPWVQKSEDIFVLCQRTQRTCKGIFLVKSQITYKYWLEFISTVVSCLLKSTSLNLLLSFSISLSLFPSFPDIP